MNADTRRQGMSREQVKLNNQSNVYDALKRIGHPATVADITRNVTGIVDRTVRRAIDSLIKTGHVIETGRHEGATLYAVKDALPMTVQERGMVPYANGKMMSVENFIDLMVNPDTNPLKRTGDGATKRDVLTQDMRDAIRQRMVFVVLTAGEPGFDQAVNTFRNGLISIQRELEFIQNVLDSFINSPVWYDHYRDQLATGVRAMVKDNPELFQLAKDYISNLAPNKEAA